MAKVEVVKKKSKKRKIKPDEQDVQSPTTKFKKLDLRKGSPKSNYNKKVKSELSTECSSSAKPKPAKRKTFTTLINNTKPRKRTKLNKYESDSDDDDDEQGHIVEVPTQQQLDECLRPENILSIQSIREKKKAKHQQNIDGKMLTGYQKELDRNFNYLNQWKTNHSAWKFEKLRQISIQTNIFKNETDYDNSMWTIALEYLAETKGAARQQLLKQAEDIIERIDKEVSADNSRRTELVSDKTYNRARELLQMLQ